MYHDIMLISGFRNRHYDSADILDPETFNMRQFLARKTSLWLCRISDPRYCYSGTESGHINHHYHQENLYAFFLWKYISYNIILLYSIKIETTCRQVMLHTIVIFHQITFLLHSPTIIFKKAKVKLYKDISCFLFNIYFPLFYFFE